MSQRLRIPFSVTNTLFATAAFFMGIFFLQRAFNIFIPVTYRSVLSMTIFLCAFGISLAWLHRKFKAASSSHLRHECAMAAIGTAVSLVLLFALVYWSIFQIYPRQFAISTVAVDERGRSAIERIRSQLENDSKLIVCLLALQTFPNEEELNLDDDWNEVQLSNSISMTKVSEAPVGPSGPIPAERIVFYLEGDPVKLESSLKFNPFSIAERALSTNERNKYELEIANADSLVHLQQISGEYISVLVEYREGQLNLLHTQLSDQADLGIWDFVYCSVAAFTTLGTGDVVPARTTARLLVGAEAVLALVLAGYGADLLFRSRRTDPPRAIDHEE